MSKGIKLLLGLLLLMVMVSGCTKAKEELPEDHAFRNPLVKAQILEKISEVETEDYGMKTTVQTFKVKILEGEFVGEVVDAVNNMDSSFAYNVIVEDHDKYILVNIEKGEDSRIQNVYVAELVRDRYLLWLVIIFALLMIIVGGLKGFKSLLTLVLITGAIFFFMLPRILEGQDPVMLTIATSVFVIVTTILLISGFNRKSTAAIIGTIGGVIGAAIIAYVFEELANVTGLAMEEAQALMYVPQGTEFNYKGLFLAGILLGALGAVMDVSMSIASSIQEIYQANKDVSVGKLFKSGMNVGKDIMGTMSNTLILAYTGASMNLMILLMAHKVPMNEILNKDMIASEIVRGLTGTIGLIMTIPVTAFIAAYLYKKSSEKTIKE